jgi:hypothetical protein
VFTAGSWRLQRLKLPPILGLACSHRHCRCPQPPPICIIHCPPLSAVPPAAAAAATAAAAAASFRLGDIPFSSSRGFNTAGAAVVDRALFPLGLTSGLARTWTLLLGLRTGRGGAPPEAGPAGGVADMPELFRGPAGLLLLLLPARHHDKLLLFCARQCMSWLEGMLQHCSLPHSLHCMPRQG